MHSPYPRRNQSSGNPAVIIIIVFAVIYLLSLCVTGGVVVLNLFPIATEINRIEDDFESKNRGRQIMVQMHNYHDANRILPPAYTIDTNGKPLHSWRTLLLPFFGCAEFEQLDLSKPWDDPKNLQILRSIDVSRFYESPRGTQRAYGATNFVAVVDDSTAIRADKSMTLSEIGGATGISQTTVLIEVPEADIPWYEPRDVTLDEAVHILQNSTYEKGIVVVMADAEAKSIMAQKMNEQTLRKLLNTNEK